MSPDTLAPNDADYFERNPRRETRLRAYQESDPAPMFGEWRPAQHRQANGTIVHMNLAALVHRSGSVHLFYVPPSTPLDADWFLDELPELITNPPMLVELPRKRGYDGGWLGAIPAPIL